MKPILIISIVILITQFVEAGFIRYSLKQKITFADLIVQGKVISVTRLLPEGNRIGAKGTKGSYMGPQSVAVIEIENIWKISKHPKFFPDARSKGKDMPKYIVVPCDYGFFERPSDLTNNISYIMFLRDLGANIFHPLNAGCTHVIHKDRVANSGMNHSPGKDWEEKSILLSAFKSKVEELLALQKKAIQDAGKPEK